MLCVLLLFANPIGTRASDQPPPLPIEEMRAVVYTKAFAKRFALPEPEPEGGVQAMEFAGEDAKAKYPHKRFATYQCVLKVYLNLPIQRKA